MRSLNNSTPISYIRRARHKYFQNCNGLKACARTIEVLLDYPIISTGLGQELFLGSQQRDQSPDACFSDRTGRTSKYDASGKKKSLKRIKIKSEETLNNLVQNEFILYARNSDKDNQTQTGSKMESYIDTINLHGFVLPQTLEILLLVMQQSDIYTNIVTWIAGHFYSTKIMDFSY